MKQVIHSIINFFYKIPYSSKVIKILAILLLLFFIVAGVANYFLPEEVVPVQQNSWQGVTPGYKISSQAATNLGTLLGSRTTSQGTELYFESAFASKPNTIILDKNTQKVVFIKEPVVYSEEVTLEQFVAEFGDPDIIKFAPQISTAVKAYVFLDDGLVVFAHVKNNAVEEKWYFDPNYDEKTFLLYWGKELSDSSGIGESFQ